MEEYDNHSTTTKTTITLLAYSCRTPSSRYSGVKVSPTLKPGPAFLVLLPPSPPSTPCKVPVILTHDDNVWQSNHILVDPTIMMGFAYPEAIPLLVIYDNDPSIMEENGLSIASALTLQPCGPPTLSSAKNGNKVTDIIQQQYRGCLVQPGCTLLVMEPSFGTPYLSSYMVMKVEASTTTCTIGPETTLIFQQPPPSLPNGDGHGLREGQEEGEEDGSRSAYEELRGLLTSRLDCGSSMRGVQMGSLLLAGPSGVGKTRLVHELLRDVGGRYVRGMEVFTRLLRGDMIGLWGWEKEQDQPCLLVVDDIDVFLYDEEDAGTSEAQRALRLLRGSVRDMWPRTAVILVTAQGLDDTGGASTTGKVRLLRSLQPSLYERVVNMRPPSSGERRVLLRRLLGYLPLQDNSKDKVNDYASRLADITGGYVAGDLLRLCRTASLLTAQSPSQQPPSPSSLLPPPPPPSTITWAHLHRARGLTPPSQLRGLDVLSPDPQHFSWSAFGGYHKVKSRLQQLVQWPWSYADTFQRMGVKPCPGILLYGPSGCGKTLLAQIIATEAKANFVHVHVGDVLSKYLGDSEARLRGLFAQARQASPCILFFDELDCMAANREGGDAGDADSVYSRLLSTLLNELDGIISGSRHHVMVLAATNRKEAIDAALLRPGRLQEALYIGVPDVKDYEAIMRVAVRGVPVDDGVDLKEVGEALLAQTGGPTVTCADLVAVCREAAMETLRESLHDSKVVARRHFHKALEHRVRL